MRARSVGAVLMTTTQRPVASAATVWADPSRIAADPLHLILLVMLVLAGVGYLLYRRARHKRANRSQDGDGR